MSPGDAAPWVRDAFSVSHYVRVVTGPGTPADIDSLALLDGMVDAVVLATAAGVITYVNPAAAELLGSDAVDVVGMPLTIIIPERLRELHAAGFRRFVESRQPRLVGGAPVRLPVLRADGTEVDIDLALSLHTTRSGEDLFVGTLRGIEDRIELERQRSVAAYLATSREVMTRLALSSGAVTLDEAAPILLEALGEGLRWDGGAMWSVDGGVLRPIRTWAPPGDDVAATMTDGIQMAVGEGLPGSVARDGESIWLETVSEESVFLRQDRAAQMGVRSCFAFPVFVNGEVTGVVEMYSRAVHAPEPELLAILQAAGLEIGRYLERAQTRRHLVEMAEALQASLLPPLSPMVPGLDIAVRYRAAGGDGQIGGDFFDVFPLPDGEWAVLIGDVSGRGPRAAALTALARYTLRAAAIGAGAPSAVLTVLNDVVRRELDVSYGGEERFLTVAYMTVRPAEDGYEVQLACGGHPYPLARRADGSIEEVVCEGDLIGAFDVHESADTSTLLREDDLLVLVTDGVTEARRDGDEFGEERLKRAIAEAPAGTASELADAIEAAVLDHLGSNAQDDVAIVVLRLPPEVENHNASIDVKVAEVA